MSRPTVTVTATGVPDWERRGDYGDIHYDVAEGIAKITIARPEVRNAFRPQTLFELQHAFHAAHEDLSVGVIILTGEGHEAFCSGGDQRIRGDGGYVGDDGVPRLNVLDLHRQIRSIPKPVIAMVAGYAIGGGNVLATVCDMTIAGDNAWFGQTGPKVGSFDAGYGTMLLARIVGHKKAGEIWFLCRQYDAEEAREMGLANAVFPVERLEEETVNYCREILCMSPTALRFIKRALIADTDGLAGMQMFAGDSTLLYYLSEEAKEGKNAFLEKRPPDFSKYERFHRNPLNESDGSTRADVPDPLSPRFAGGDVTEWQRGAPRHPMAPPSACGISPRKAGGEDPELGGGWGRTASRVTMNGQRDAVGVQQARGPRHGGANRPRGEW